MQKIFLLRLLPTISLNSLTVLYRLSNTGYFTINTVVGDRNKAEQLFKEGKVQFIINIPENFTRNMIRSKQPHILLEGDATDPVAIVNAFHAADTVVNDALRWDLKGSLNYLAPKDSNFIIDTHANYNPAILAQYHTLPGLLVAVLTMTLTMLTAISITSEFEQGTMEVLLITPIQPLEVILGKIIPHIMLGYSLFFLTIGLSHYVYHVPFYGSFLLLTVLALPFIIASLGIGLTASAISKTQFQAANTTNTYVLPAILLSGFMFPFYAMPLWAQKIGELLPPTHFLRITINIMLKGGGFVDIWPDLWPMLVFMVLIIGISFRFYRITLD